MEIKIVQETHRFLLISKALIIKPDKLLHFTLQQLYTCCVYRCFNVIKPVWELNDTAVYLRDMHPTAPILSAERQVTIFGFLTFLTIKPFFSSGLPFQNNIHNYLRLRLMTHVFCQAKNSKNTLIEQIMIFICILLEMI